jgi:hypothetical protein
MLSNIPVISRSVVPSPLANSIVPDISPGKLVVSVMPLNRGSVTLPPFALRETFLQGPPNCHEVGGAKRHVSPAIAAD